MQLYRNAMHEPWFLDNEVEKQLFFGRGQQH
jgi:hypothetical protein